MLKLNTGRIAKMLTPSLSVIFSFRNESEVIPELVRRAREVLEKEKCNKKIVSYELIFVNDASTDNSLEVLLKLAEKHRQIRIVNMSRCFGVSPCVIAGMQHSSGDLIVYMDSDLQDPPEIIPQLLDSYFNDSTVDVIHTVRKSRKGESKIKLFITRIGYIILNKLSLINLPVEAGDFKLLSKRAVEHILTLNESNPYLRGLVCWIGFKQIFVHYDRDARHAGKTKFNVFSRGVLDNFLGSALISFSSAPLKIATFMGVAAILIDILVMGHALFEKIQGRAVPGWTALMVVVLFFCGVQLFCLGLMGLYINSLHVQSKRRPLYIVESTHGF